MKSDNELIKYIERKIGAVESLTEVLDCAFKKQDIDRQKDAVDEFRRIACKYREKIINRQVAPQWVGDDRIDDVKKILSSIEMLRGDVEFLAKNIRNDFYENFRGEGFLASCFSNNSFESMIGEDEGTRNFLSDVLEKLGSWNKYFKKSVVDEFGFDTGSDFFRKDAVSLFDELLRDLLMASHSFKLKRISKSKSGIAKKHDTLHIFNEIFDFCGFQVSWFYPKRDFNKYSIHGMVKARLLKTTGTPICVQVPQNLLDFPGAYNFSAWYNINIEGIHFEIEEHPYFNEEMDQVVIREGLPKFARC